jgi:hypothetical protein
MKNILLVIWNLVLLGLVILGVEYYDQNPRILVYAFLLAYTLKLLTIEGILLVHEERIFPFTAGLLPYMSKNPPPGIVSQPFIEEGSNKPIKLPGYLLLMGGIFFCIIIMLHVNKRHTLDFEWGVFFREISWGAFLAFFCWIGDVITRAIIIDVNASREINYGYNNREVVVIAFAVLLGALAVMVFQMRGQDPTPWVIYGPMLVLKQFSDMRQAKKR